MVGKLRSEVEFCKRRVDAIGKQIQGYGCFDHTPEALLDRFAEACKDLDRALLAAEQGDAEDGPD